MCLRSRFEFQSCLQAPLRSDTSGGVSSNKTASTSLPGDCSNFAPSCHGDASFVDVALLRTFKILLHQTGSETQFGVASKGADSARCHKQTRTGSIHPLSIHLSIVWMPAPCPCPRQPALPKAPLSETPHPCTGTGGGHSMQGCRAFPRLR